MPLWRRVRDAIATALMWLLYAALINAAIIGVWDLVNGRVTTLEGARVVAVVPTLREYGIVIAVNGVLLVGWAVYNWLRFRGADRRRGRNPVPPEVVARHFGADEALMARLAATRIGVLHHDEAGRIVAFESETPDGSRTHATPIAAQ